MDGCSGHDSVSWLQPVIRDSQLWSIISNDLQRSFLQSSYTSSWRMRSQLVTTGTNSTLREDYDTKKRQMEGMGIDIKETFLYCCYDSLDKVKRISYEGLQCRKAQYNYLGDSTKAVTMCLHPDVQLKSVQQQKKERCWIVMFKVILGRIKMVPISQYIQQPDPKYDCHLPDRQPNDTMSVGTQALHSQVYIYELDQCGVHLQRPRQVLPYAVIEFVKDPTSQVAGVFSPLYANNLTSHSSNISDGVTASQFRDNSDFVNVGTARCHLNMSSQIAPPNVTVSQSSTVHHRQPPPPYSQANPLNTLRSVQIPPRPYQFCSVQQQLAAEQQIYSAQQYQQQIPQQLPPHRISSVSSQVVAQGPSQNPAYSSAEQLHQRFGMRMERPQASQIVANQWSSSNAQPLWQPLTVQHTPTVNTSSHTNLGMSYTDRAGQSSEIASSSLSSANSVQQRETATPGGTNIAQLQAAFCLQGTNARVNLPQTGIGMRLPVASRVPRSSSTDIDPPQPPQTLVIAPDEDWNTESLVSRFLGNQQEILREDVLTTSGDMEADIKIESRTSHRHRDSAIIDLDCSDTEITPPLVTVQGEKYVAKRPRNQTVKRLGRRRNLSHSLNVKLNSRRVLKCHRFKKVTELPIIRVTEAGDIEVTMFKMDIHTGWGVHQKRSRKNVSRNLVSYIKRKLSVKTGGNLSSASIEQCVSVPPQPKQCIEVDKPHQLLPSPLDGRFIGQNHSPPVEAFHDFDFDLPVLADDDSVDSATSNLSQSYDCNTTANRQDDYRESVKDTTAHEYTPGNKSSNSRLQSMLADDDTVDSATLNYPQSSDCNATANKQDDERESVKDTTAHEYAPRNKSSNSRLQSMIASLKVRIQPGSVELGREEANMNYNHGKTTPSEIHTTSNMTTERKHVCDSQILNAQIPTIIALPSMLTTTLASSSITAEYADTPSENGEGEQNLNKAECQMPAPATSEAEQDLSRFYPIIKTLRNRKPSGTSVKQSSDLTENFVVLSVEYDNKPTTDINPNKEQSCEITPHSIGMPDMIMSTSHEDGKKGKKNQSIIAVNSQHMCANKDRNENKENTNLIQVSSQHVCENNSRIAPINTSELSSSNLHTYFTVRPNLSEVEISTDIERQTCTTPCEGTLPSVSREIPAASEKGLEILQKKSLKVLSSSSVPRSGLTTAEKSADREKQTSIISSLKDKNQDLHSSKMTATLTTSEMGVEVPLEETLQSISSSSIEEPSLSTEKQTSYNSSTNEKGQDAPSNKIAGTLINSEKRVELQLKKSSSVEKPRLPTVEKSVSEEKQTSITPSINDKLQDLPSGKMTSEKGVKLLKKKTLRSLSESSSSIEPLTTSEADSLCVEKQKSLKLAICGSIEKTEKTQWCRLSAYDKVLSDGSLPSLSGSDVEKSISDRTKKKTKRGRCMSKEKNTLKSHQNSTVTTEASEAKSAGVQTRNDLQAGNSSGEASNTAVQETQKRTQFISYSDIQAMESSRRRRRKSSSDKRNDSNVKVCTSLITNAEPPLTHEKHVLKGGQKVDHTKSKLCPAVDEGEGIVSSKLSDHNRTDESDDDHGQKRVISVTEYWRRQPTEKDSSEADVVERHSEKDRIKPKKDTEFEKWRNIFKQKQTESHCSKRDPRLVSRENRRSLDNFNNTPMQSSISPGALFQSNTPPVSATITSPRKTMNFYTETMVSPSTSELQCSKHNVNQQPRPTSTVAVPAATVAIPASTVAVLAATVTVSSATVAVPSATVAIPAAATAVLDVSDNPNVRDHSQYQLVLIDIPIKISPLVNMNMNTANLEDPRVVKFLHNQRQSELPPPKQSTIEVTASRSTAPAGSNKSANVNIEDQPNDQEILRKTVQNHQGYGDALSDQRTFEISTNSSGKNDGPVVDTDDQLVKHVVDDNVQKQQDYNDASSDSVTENSCSSIQNVVQQEIIVDKTHSISVVDIAEFTSATKVPADSSSHQTSKEDVDADVDEMIVDSTTNEFGKNIDRLDDVSSLTVSVTNEKENAESNTECLISSSVEKIISNASSDENVDGEKLSNKADQASPMKDSYLNNDISNLPRRERTTEKQMETTQATADCSDASSVVDKLSAVIGKYGAGVAATAALSHFVESQADITKQNRDASTMSSAVETETMKTEHLPRKKKHKSPRKCHHHKRLLSHQDKKAKHSRWGMKKAEKRKLIEGIPHSNSNGTTSIIYIEGLKKISEENGRMVDNPPKLTDGFQAISPKCVADNSPNPHSVQAQLAAVKAKKEANRSVIPVAKPTTSDERITHTRKSILRQTSSESDRCVSLSSEENNGKIQIEVTNDDPNVSTSSEPDSTSSVNKPLRQYELPETLLPHIGKASSVVLDLMKSYRDADMTQKAIVQALGESLSDWQAYREKFNKESDSNNSDAKLSDIQREVTDLKKIIDTEEEDIKLLCVVKNKAIESKEAAKSLRECSLNKKKIKLEMMEKEIICVPDRNEKCRVAEKLPNELRLRRETEVYISQEGSLLTLAATPTSQQYWQLHLLKSEIEKHSRFLQLAMAARKLELQNLLKQKLGFFHTQRKKIILEVCVSDLGKKYTAVKTCISRLKFYRECLGDLEVEKELVSENLNLAPCRKYIVDNIKQIEEHLAVLHSVLFFEDTQLWESGGHLEDEDAVLSIVRQSQSLIVPSEKHIRVARLKSKLSSKNHDNLKILKGKGANQGHHSYRKDSEQVLKPCDSYKGESKDLSISDRQNVDTRKAANCSTFTQPSEEKHFLAINKSNSKEDIFDKSEELNPVDTMEPPSSTARMYNERSISSCNTTINVSELLATKAQKITSAETSNVVVDSVHRHKRSKNRVHKQSNTHRRSREHEPTSKDKHSTSSFSDDSDFSTSPNKSVVKKHLSPGCRTGSHSSSLRHHPSYFERRSLYGSSKSISPECESPSFIHRSRKSISPKQQKRSISPTDTSTRSHSPKRRITSSKRHSDVKSTSKHKDKASIYPRISDGRKKSMTPWFDRSKSPDQSVKRKRWIDRSLSPKRITKTYISPRKRGSRSRSPKRHDGSSIRSPKLSKGTRHKTRWDSRNKASERNDRSSVERDLQFDGHFDSYTSKKYGLQRHNSAPYGSSDKNDRYDRVLDDHKERIIPKEWDAYTYTTQHSLSQTDAKKAAPHDVYEWFDQNYLSRSSSPMTIATHITPSLPVNQQSVGRTLPSHSSDIEQRPVTLVHCEPNTVDNGQSDTLMSSNINIDVVNTDPVPDVDSLVVASKTFAEVPETENQTVIHEIHVCSGITNSLTIPKKSVVKKKSALVNIPILKEFEIKLVKLKDSDLIRAGHMLTSAKTNDPFKKVKKKKKKRRNDFVIPSVKPTFSFHSDESLLSANASQPQVQKSLPAANVKPLPEVLQRESGKREVINVSKTDSSENTEKIITSDICQSKHDSTALRDGSDMDSIKSVSDSGINVVAIKGKSPNIIKNTKNTEDILGSFAKESEKTSINLNKEKKDRSTKKAEDILGSSARKSDKTSNNFKKEKERKTNKAEDILGSSAKKPEMTSIDLNKDKKDRGSKKAEDILGSFIKKSEKSSIDLNKNKKDRSSKKAEDILGSSVKKSEKTSIDLNKEKKDSSKKAEHISGSSVKKFVKSSIDLNKQKKDRSSKDAGDIAVSSVKKSEKTSIDLNKEKKDRSSKDVEDIAGSSVKKSEKTSIDLNNEKKDRISKDADDIAGSSVMKSEKASINLNKQKKDRIKNTDVIIIKKQVSKVNVTPVKHVKNLGKHGKSPKEREGPLKVEDLLSTSLKPTSVNTNLDEQPILSNNARIPRKAVPSDNGKCITGENGEKSGNEPKVDRVDSNTVDKAKKKCTQSENKVHLSGKQSVLTENVATPSKEKQIPDKKIFPSIKIHCNITNKNQSPESKTVSKVKIDLNEKTLKTDRSPNNKLVMLKNGATPDNKVSQVANNNILTTFKSKSDTLKKKTPILQKKAIAHKNNSIVTDKKINQPLRTIGPDNKKTYSKIDQPSENEAVSKTKLLPENKEGNKSKKSVKRDKKLVSDIGNASDKLEKKTSILKQKAVDLKNNSLVTDNKIGQPLKTIGPDNKEIYIESKVDKLSENKSVSKTKLLPENNEVDKSKKNVTCDKKLITDIGNKSDALEKRTSIVQKNVIAHKNSSLVTDKKIAQPPKAIGPDNKEIYIDSTVDQPSENKTVSKTRLLPESKEVDDSKKNVKRDKKLISDVANKIQTNPENKTDPSKNKTTVCENNSQTLSKQVHNPKSSGKHDTKLCQAGTKANTSDSILLKLEKESILARLSTLIKQKACELKKEQLLVNSDDGNLKKIIKPDNRPCQMNIKVNAAENIHARHESRTQFSKQKSAVSGNKIPLTSNIVDKPEKSQKLASNVCQTGSQINTHHKIMAKPENKSDLTPEIKTSKSRNANVQANELLPESKEDDDSTNINPSNKLCQLDSKVNATKRILHKSENEQKPSVPASKLPTNNKDDTSRKSSKTESKLCQMRSKATTVHENKLSMDKNVVETMSENKCEPHEKKITKSKENISVNEKKLPLTDNEIDACENNVMPTKKLGQVDIKIDISNYNEKIPPLEKQTVIWKKDNTVHKKQTLPENYFATAKKMTQANKGQQVQQSADNTANNGQQEKYRHKAQQKISKNKKIETEMMKPIQIPNNEPDNRASTVQNKLVENLQKSAMSENAVSATGTNESEVLSTKEAGVIEVTKNKCASRKINVFNKTPLDVMDERGDKGIEKTVSTTCDKRGDTINQKQKNMESDYLIKVTNQSEKGVKKIISKADDLNSRQPIVDSTVEGISFYTNIASPKKCGQSIHPSATVLLEEGKQMSIASNLVSSNISDSKYHKIHHQASRGSRHGNSSNKRGIVEESEYEPSYKRKRRPTNHKRGGYNTSDSVDTNTSVYTSSDSTHDQYETNENSNKRYRWGHSHQGHRSDHSQDDYNAGSHQWRDDLECRFEHDSNKRWVDKDNHSGRDYNERCDRDDHTRERHCDQWRRNEPSHEQQWNGNDRWNDDRDLRQHNDFDHLPRGHHGSDRHGGFNHRTRHQNEQPSSQEENCEAGWDNIRGSNQYSSDCHISPNRRWRRENESGGNIRLLVEEEHPRHRDSEKNPNHRWHRANEDGSTIRPVIDEDDPRHRERSPDRRWRHRNQSGGNIRHVHEEEDARQTLQLADMLSPGESSSSWGQERRGENNWHRTRPYWSQN